MYKKFRKIRRKALAILLLATFVVASIQIWGYFAPQESLASIMDWSFNEGYGTTTNDTSGNSNSGTITNAVWRQSDLCRTEKCLYFDGSGDYVSITDAASGGDLDFVAADDFTITGWFRHAEIATNPDYLVTKHESGTAGGYKVYMDSDGDIAFGIDDDGTWGPEDVVGDDLGRNLDDNRWHHFAAVKDGTTGIYLYIDGVLVDSDTSLTATGDLTNAASFYVGIDADGSSNSWAGFIDEIKVHREARTASYIKGDYLSGAPQDGASASFGMNDKSWLSDGLVAYWKMDESAANSCGSSNDTCDQVGNGYNGDWNGDVSVASGKYGNGALFDGTTDGIDFGSNDITQIAGYAQVSFSAWIRPDFVTTEATRRNIFINGDQFSIIFNQNQDDFTVSSNLSGVDVSNFHTDGLSWTQNTWHHIAYTYDGTTASLYWDGELENTVSASGVLNSNYGTFIGSAADFSQSWLGSLDEIRLYGRALSNKEIKNLYSGWSPEPIGYWDMNENTGTTSIYDKSTLGSTGTINGSMTESDWVPGKYGSSLDFDGSDDYINIYSSTLQTAFTGLKGSLGAWIKVSSSVYSDNSTRRVAYFGADDDNNVSIYKNSSNQLTLQYEANNTIVSYNLGTSPTEWTYLAMTWDDENDSAKYYVNGVLVETDTSIGTWVGSLASTRANISEQTTTGSQFWLGLIDDVRLYNYPRTAKQIIEDMNAGHPAPGSPVGSPVSHWKMDEGYGTTTYDQTLNDNNLTLSSDSWTDSGKFGKAFNGTGANRVSIADDSDFDFSESEDFTLSTWFKSDSATNPGAAEYIIDKGTGTGYAIYADTSGFISFGIDSDGTWSPADSATSTADFYDGVWHHAVAVKTGVSRIDLYIDGILVGSDTTIAATGTLVNADSLTFADQDTTDDGDEFFGDIDEVSIYRSALTADEIKILFNQGSIKLGSLSTDSTGTVPSDAGDRSYCVPGDTSTCSAPVDEWLMNENTGTGTDVVKDTSTNSFDGDTNGITESSWVPGKYGSGLRFNGTTSYVSTGAITAIEGIDTVSFSAWIRPDFINTDASNHYVFFSQRFSVFFTAAGATDDFRASVTTSGGTTAVDTTSVSWTNNEWHHITAVYTGAALKIYWDGKLEASNARTGTVSTSTAGEIGGSGGTGSWLGDLDQVRFYNYARTPAQVAWDYNYGAPLVYFKFDDCTGTTANNSAPDPRGLDAGLDGTITIGPGGANTSAGTCSSGTSTQAWNNGTTGKRNYSLDFDGVDDDVRVGNTGSIDFDDGLDESVSFSAWFYANSDGETDVGRIFGKGSSNTYCRTDSQSGSTIDLECSMDLATTDATLNLTGALSTNTWHHVVMTYSDDADDEITIYLDGVNRGSSTGGDGGPATPDTADLQIGSNGSGGVTFDGQIDDFALFNYELTRAQVLSVMNQGAVRFGPSSGHP